MNGKIAKISFMAIIEEDLRIELVLSTYILEMHYLLHPDIPIRISIWCIVDYPVFRSVVVKILGIVCCLVKYHICNKSLGISSS